MSARIAITSVDHELAPFAVISGWTEALELLLRHWHAIGAILAGESEASVTLGENLVADRSAAYEAAGGSRE